jgi:intracellular sulfur oxidation DsrE/DsrF family protein
MDISKQSLSSPGRRSLFTCLNAGVASLIAMAGSRIAMAQEKAIATTPWKPARHKKDDWLDQVSVKHRMVFDTITPDTLGLTLAFAGNFFRTNQREYGLGNSDLAVVIIVRHRSTPFAYNDAMWAKYGVTLAAQSKAEDPKTKMPPKVNIYNAAGYGDSIPTRGVTMEALARLGAQIAVCSVATRGYASAIAHASGGTVDAIFMELTSNLVSNARMVPAGIVAVNRAQERGYTLACA